MKRSQGKKARLWGKARCLTYTAAGALAAILFGSAVPAQSQAHAPETRSLTVNVVDNKGRPIRDLSAPNFMVTIDGKAVRTVSATSDPGSRRIVLLVNMGWTMASNRQMELAWVAADYICRTLGGSNDIAILTYSGSVREVAPFTRNPASLSAAILRVVRDETPWGRTMLMDGLAAAAQYFDSPRYGDTIVLMTDGFEYGSKHSKEDMELILASSGARLFVLGLHGKQKMPPGRFYDPGYFPVLIELSGGALVEVNASWSSTENVSKSMIKAMGPMIDAIADSYRLEVELPVPMKPKQRWGVQIVDPSGRRDRRARCTYPRVLVASGAARQ